MTQPARKSGDQHNHGVATTADLSAANINPRTGLATDYLNHFNDALMLLDIIRDAPDCADDFLAWRPRTYIQHFDASHFTARDLVISVYENTDPKNRATFDSLTGVMTAMLIEVGQAMDAAQRDDARAKLAGQAADQLRPLMIQAGGIISGDVVTGPAQTCAAKDASL